MTTGARHRRVRSSGRRSRPFDTCGLSPPQWTSESIHRERFKLLKFETRHHSRRRQRVAVASEGELRGEKYPPTTTRYLVWKWFIVTQ